MTLTKALSQSEEYNAVVVIGMLPDGGVSVATSATSTLACHVALNRAQHHINVLEYENVKNKRTRDAILKEALEAQSPAETKEEK